MNKNLQNRVEQMKNRIKHKASVVAATLLATTGGLVSQANAENVQRDDKQSTPTELFVNDVTNKSPKDTIDISKSIFGNKDNPSAIYNSIAKTNLILSDGKIVVNDYSTLNELNIDINDYNLQIPDNILGSDVLNQITPSNMSIKVDKYAKTTKGHKGLCTGDVKVLFEKLYRKNIKDINAWWQIVWCDQFFDFVKKGNLRGYTAFIPNQDIIKNDANFCAITCWFGKTPKTQKKHTGYHPSSKKRLNEEYKIFNPYGCVAPRNYKGVGLCMPIEDIIPILQSMKDYTLILDKDSKTIAFQLTSPELKLEISKAIIDEDEHITHNEMHRNALNAENTYSVDALIYTDFTGKEPTIKEQTQLALNKNYPFPKKSKTHTILTRYAAPYNPRGGKYPPRSESRGS